MSYKKILYIIFLSAVSVGLLNIGDTSALDNHGLPKISVSKDTQPALEKVEFNDLGILTASWYGSKFHGKSTANGEIYNQTAFTAAHKTFPFGTLLHVTNFRNGKSVVVRINDRGPYIEGRDLDLSKGTARALGILRKGVVRVKVEELVINSDVLSVKTLN